MPNFSYIAVDNKGTAAKGIIEQPDRASAISAVIKQGLRPVSINEVKSKTSGINPSQNIFESKKVKPDQLVIFTRQLSAMIGAGVPLLRALTALSEHMESLALKNIMTSVIHDIEGGAMLGDALAKYPNIFDDIYVNMVRAGEAAGILDEILKRLAMQQEKSMAMRKKIKSAMAYPMVLLSITVLAFFGLMIFIVPKIGKIVTDMSGSGSSLPMLTVIMLNISDFIINFWYIIAIVAFALIYAISAYLKTKKGKRQLHSILLKLPVIKEIVMKVAVAHFARTFAALTEAGVAVLESLSVTSRAVGNVIYEEALVQAEIDVKNGKTLSSVIGANELFPPIVSQMLAVGEETGQTDKVIVKVADFYEEEVDSSVSSISSIIEPIMIVIMGSMVGLIAASVMLPIAQLSTSIQ